MRRQGERHLGLSRPPAVISDPQPANELPDDSTGPLRIGLTISGAVSLGAYEGGALAALLVALKELSSRSPDVVVVDAIAGASAGSMTGVLAAKGLLTDADPLELMYQAWVEAPSLRRLRGRRRSAAPLSVDKVQSTARELLGDSYPRGAGAPQQAPVELQLALGALRGLDYTFRRLQAPPLDATTYLDWYALTFRPQDGAEAYLDALDPALASGAHAVAFPPRVLSRAERRADYERNGVTNFPPGGELWYTDGGTIDNEPLGRALDMTGRLDESSQGRRLNLLIVPDPSFPVAADSPEWADPNRAPLWLQTLARAGKMAIAQTLYDDLRRAEKTNSRLTWTDQLVDTLASHLTPDAAPALADLIERFESTRSEDLGASSTQPAPPPKPDDPIPVLLQRAMAAATGLQGKRPIAVDAVSPLILGADTREAVNKRLAGEKFGHFFGFLDRRLRISDFALGYTCMLAWLDDPARGLRARGVPPELVTEAVAAASARQDSAWTDEGGFGVSRLRLGAWIQLVRLSLHTVRLAGSDLLAWPRRQRRG